MKAGTRITVQVGPSLLTGKFEHEPAKVARTMPHMLPMTPGYVPVRFPDGSRVLIHESAIRVA